MGKEGSCCGCNSQKLSNALYVYAGVEGNITLDNEEYRIVEALDTADGPVYPCIRGTLAGFDPVTGVFTAQKTALYDVSVWIDYFRDATAPVLDGVTTTAINRELIENICGSPGNGSTGPNVICQTAPFSLTDGPGSFPVASSSLGGSIPLRAGEKIRISVYQQNDQDESVQVFMELMIVQREYINLDTLRGPGTEV